MIKKLSLSFIGAGHLAGALVRGLIKSGYPAKLITVSNRSSEKLESLVEELGIVSARTNTEAAEVADVIFLAVKPQYIKEVCREISPAIIEKKPMIISLASTVRLEDIALALGVDNLAIIRAMTNTPTEFCKGASALFANSLITTSQTEHVNELFNAIGMSFWVEKEADLDTLTAPVGCAPAYVFLFLQALQDAAVSMGFSSSLAREIALHSVIGAAELAKQSGDSFASLRENVSTPGGVTAYSLKHISVPQLVDSVKEVFNAAEQRIAEIDASLRNK